MIGRNDASAYLNDRLLCEICSLLIVDVEKLFVEI